MDEVSCREYDLPYCWDSNSSSELEKMDFRNTDKGGDDQITRSLKYNSIDDKVYYDESLPEEPQHTEQGIQKQPPNGSQGRPIAKSPGQLDRASEIDQVLFEISALITSKYERLHPHVDSGPHDCNHWKMPWFILTLDDIAVLRPGQMTSDNLIHTLFNSEVPETGDVYFEDPSVFASCFQYQGGSESSPTPFLEVSSDATQILVAHEMSHHWLVLHIFVDEDSEGRINIYDPYGQIEPAKLEEIRSKLPGIIRPATQQPRFPDLLKNVARTEDCIVVVGDGPQMSSTPNDCGLVSLDITTHLAKKMALPAAKSNDREKAVYGEQLRLKYAEILRDKISITSAQERDNSQHEVVSEAVHFDR